MTRYMAPATINGVPLYPWLAASRPNWVSSLLATVVPRTESNDDCFDARPDRFGQVGAGHERQGGDAASRHAEYLWVLELEGDGGDDPDENDREQRR